LVAFHVGDEAVRPGEMLGEPVDVAWNFLPMAAVCDALVAAGLAVELRLDRAPYPTEHPCRRGYVMARKPR
ncbi:MAG: hypothetical protein KC464_28785, partial [Myxococcales bacterium]|nr:hypothetical protein [Myxococcales bacterium]